MSVAAELEAQEARLLRAAKVRLVLTLIAEEDEIRAGDDDGEFAVLDWINKQAPQYIDIDRGADIGPEDCLDGAMMLTPAAELQRVCRECGELFAWLMRQAKEPQR